MSGQLQAGKVVGGKYRLEKQLGMGSMGSVWAARNELTDRAFAVKFMKPEFARDPVLVQRFLNEARVCGRLDHPSIVEIYDLGEAEGPQGSPFLVMELLRGEGLDTLLERSGRLDPRAICPIVVDIAGALDQAHQHGIVHRDVKPSNVFLHRNRAGEVVPKLLDFGVSKVIEGGADADITRVGSVLGSPLYMAPEQARGQSDVDPRADLWALGVLMYEAISGSMPFANGTYNAVLSAILTHRHRPLRELVPDLPIAISDIVDLCLVKDRNRRMASAAQLASRLESALVQLAAPSVSLPPPSAPVVAPPSRPLATTAVPAASPSTEASSDFVSDEKTDIMSREDLLAMLPGNLPSEPPPPEVPDSIDPPTRRSDREALSDSGEQAPPSRTAVLRRLWLAELGPSVKTSKTDDIAERASLPPVPDTRSERRQRVEGQLQSLERRSSRPPAAIEPPSPAPPSRPSVEPGSDEQAARLVEATSEAIRLARENLHHSDSEAPHAPAEVGVARVKPSDLSGASGQTETPPSRGNPLYLIVAAVLMLLSVTVALLSRR